MDKGALSLNALFDQMFFSTRGRLPPGNAECSKTCLWSSPNFCETFVQLLKLGLTSLSSRSNAARVAGFCTRYSFHVGNLFTVFASLIASQVDHSGAVES